MHPSALSDNESTMLGADAQSAYACVLTTKTISVLIHTACGKNQACFELGAIANSWSSCSGQDACKMRREVSCYSTIQQGYECVQRATQRDGPVRVEVSVQCQHLLICKDRLRKAARESSEPRQQALWDPRFGMWVTVPLRSESIYLTSRYELDLTGHRRMHSLDNECLYIHVHTCLSNLS
jgi:hypothetical protein